MGSSGIHSIQYGYHLLQMLFPMMDCFGWLFMLSRADVVMSHMMVDLNCMAINTFGLDLGGSHCH